jgi:hypothetical protein
MDKALNLCVIAVSAIWFALRLMAGESHAATITFGAAKDNSIFQNNASNTSGGSAGMFSGTNGMGSPRRGLIAFDIAANVPAGATITAVQLTLHLGNAPLPDAQDIGLHKLTRDWGEGTAGSSNPAISGSGMGSTASPGDATWNEAMFGSVNWTNPGAEGDYAAIPSAIKSVGGPIDTPHTWDSTPALVRDVQDWLNAPAANYGWALINGNEGTVRSLKGFYTREATQNSSGVPASLDPSWRPTLTISFIDSPEPSGDYNGNGIVDAADYVLWRNTMGQPISPPGNGADGDKSGTVDAIDYPFWRSRFGKLIDRAQTGVSVPEPATNCLLLLGSFHALLVFRQRPCVF